MWVAWGPLKGPVFQLGTIMLSHSQLSTTQSQASPEGTGKVLFNHQKVMAKLAENGTP